MPSPQASFPIGVSHPHCAAPSVLGSLSLTISRYRCPPRGHCSPDSESGIWLHVGTQACTACSHMTCTYGTHCLCSQHTCMHGHSMYTLPAFTYIPRHTHCLHAQHNQAYTHTCIHAYSLHTRGSHPSVDFTPNYSISPLQLSSQLDVPRRSGGHLSWAKPGTPPRRAGRR